MYNQIRRRTHKLFAVASLSLSLLFSACQPIQPMAESGTGGEVAAAAPPVIEVGAHDYAFTLPAEVPAGLVTFNFVNHGKELHHAIIMRFSKPETPLDKVMEALDSPEPPDFLDEENGLFMGALSEGITQQATSELIPGRYLIICFLPTADGAPHATKGMLGEFNVVENKAAAQPAEPQADAMLTIKPDSVEMTEAIKAGKQTWKIENQSGVTDNGFISVVSLVDGKTIAEAWTASNNNDYSLFKQWLGGMTVKDKSKGWLTIDLPPGDYYLATGVPDPNASAPAEGQPPQMINVPFSVK